MNQELCDMDAEKMAMQRRIDTLDQHAVKLHAALTEQEREIARLTAELETVKRERDALKRDLYFECHESAHACYICKYGQNGVTQCQRDLDEDDCFEWRGVCESNGGKTDG